MPVGPITELQMFQTMQSTSDASPVLSSRFSDLLAADPPARALPEVGAPSSLSNVIDTQEGIYRKLNQDVMLAADTMPELSVQQTSALGIQLAFRVAQWDMFQTACSKLTQGVKTGVQTLMKNQ